MLQFFAAKKMKVQMEDGLPCIFTVIGEYTKTILNLKFFSKFRGN